MTQQYPLLLQHYNSSFSHVCFLSYSPMWGAIRAQLVKPQYGEMPTRYHTRRRPGSAGSRTAVRTERHGHEITTHQKTRTTHAPSQGVAIRPSDKIDQPHHLYTTIPIPLLTITTSVLFPICIQELSSSSHEYQIRSHSQLNSSANAPASPFGQQSPQDPRIRRFLKFKTHSRVLKRRPTSQHQPSNPQACCIQRRI